MGDRIEVDTSEVRALVVSLGRSADRVPSDVDGIIRKGALNVRNDLRREAEGVESAPRFPQAITFDVTSGSGWTEAEIGPEMGGPGSLALLYFGNSKSGPRLADPVGALERESGAVEQYIAKAAGDLL